MELKQFALYTVVWLCGIICGIILSSLIVDMVLYTIGRSFNIDNMNVTVSINQSMMLDAINRSRGT